MRATAITVLVAGALACAAPRAAAPDPAPSAASYAGLFTRLSCDDCHAVSALGVRAQQDVAPDLTTAYADVVIRYGVNLEAFLANPSGVMRLMLVAHLHLTQADRDSLVHVLRLLHQQRRADSRAIRPPNGARLWERGELPETYPTAW